MFLLMIVLAALPLGDGKTSTTAPRTGYVYTCQGAFGGQGGAFRDGPWIDTANRTWNARTKIAVQGDVKWPQHSFRVTASGDTRSIIGNGLPDHGTGVFPIAGDDPAYQYDRNPNHIAARSIGLTLDRTPRAAAAPTCTGGGMIGVLVDGAALYNALDGEGRDAAAHEVLDACDGHPDPSSTYHHHDVPSCVRARVKRGHTKLVGYALDGYGIYLHLGTARRAALTDGDLDECHGRTSRVRFNGKRRRVYHYEATREYPYTIGCFHGTPVSVRG